MAKNAPTPYSVHLAVSKLSQSMTAGPGTNFDWKLVLSSTLA